MFIRSLKNPVVSPIEHHAWESFKTYNPAFLFEKGEYHILYRAVGQDHISRLGYSYSFDAERFVRYDKPLIEPSLPCETAGIEDPRLVKLEDKYYLTYTGYDGDTAQLCLAVSDDLAKWEKHGPMLKGWNAQKAKSFKIKWDDARKNAVKKKWSKAGGIFPEKIDDYYWMIFGDSNLWLAKSRDGITWLPKLEPFIQPRRQADHFDSAHLEMGPPPIKTPKGWLVIYHGIDQHIVYRLGFILLDLRNPQKILYRSSQYIFEPEANYELSDQIDLFRPANLIIPRDTSSKSVHPRAEVVFCPGAALIGDELRIYYGAGDATICTAVISLEHLFGFMQY
jgi:predicted GH43/DUF377 family glycosyl hydrolase